MKPLAFSFLALLFLSSCGTVTSSATAALPEPTATLSATLTPAPSPTPTEAPKEGMTVETQTITVDGVSIEAAVARDAMTGREIAVNTAAHNAVYERVDGVWQAVDVSFETTKNDAAFERTVALILKASGVDVHEQELFDPDAARQELAPIHRELFGAWYYWCRDNGVFETRMPAPWRRAMIEWKDNYLVTAYQDKKGVDNPSPYYGVYGIQAKQSSLDAEIDETLQVGSGENSIRIPWVNMRFMVWGDLGLRLFTDEPADTAQEGIVDFGNGHFRISLFRFQPGKIKPDDGCIVRDSNTTVITAQTCNTQQDVEATSYDDFSHNGPLRYTLTRDKLDELMKKRDPIFQVNIAGSYFIMDGVVVANGLLFLK